MPRPPAAGATPGSSRAGLALDLAVTAALAAWLSKDWLFAASPTFPERDAGFNAVAMRNLQLALTGAADWRSAPLGWPIANGTTQADWMLGQAALTLPFSGWVDPSRVYELASFVGLLLTAWAGLALVRTLVGPGPHAWLGALIVGLGPLQLEHVAHANLVHHELAILGPLLLAVGLSTSKPGTAAAGGALVAGSFHFGLYAGLHAALAAGVVGAWALARARPRLATVVAAGTGFALVLATFVPVARLYLAASGNTSVGEGAGAEWDPAGSLALADGAPLHTLLLSSLPFRALHAPNAPNPGFLAGILALFGLLRARGVRGVGPLLMTAAVGSVLALGPLPHAFGHPLPFPGPSRLLTALVGDNLREPLRWLFWAQVAVGVCASAGLAALLRRTVGIPRYVLAGIVTLVATAELPHRAAPDAEEPAEGMCILDTASPGPIFESFGHCPDAGTARLRAALFHGRPLVGGNLARQSPALSAVNEVTRSWPSPTSVEFLRAAGVRVALEHPPLRRRPRDAECVTSLDDHRLCTLAERRAVPSPAAVRTQGAGPAVGVRITGDAGPTVTTRCGDVEEVHPTEAWRALAEVRGVASLDVFLETPCSGEVTANVASVPLYADADDPGWLPPVPPPGPGMAALFGSACTVRGQIP